MVSAERDIFSGLCRKQETSASIFTNKRLAERVRVY